MKSNESLPDGWRRVRLGDILHRRTEIVHPRDRPSGPATFVGLEHVEKGTGKRIGAEEIEMARMTGRRARFYQGDIVYGYLRPYLNKVWLAEFDGLCSVDQYVYHPEPGVADANYIRLFMLSPVFLGRAPIDTTPGQLPRIRSDEVDAVELDLPPLPEQERVAAVVEAQMADAECAWQAAEKQQIAAETLISSFLRDIFRSEVAATWPVVRLGDVADIGSGITLGRALDPDDVADTVPYLRVANVKDGYLDLSDVTELAVTKQEIDKSRLEYGDLLLTEGGDADKLGRGTFWQNELPLCLHQNHIFRVRFDLNAFSPRFLSAQIGSSYGKSYFAAHAKQTTGIATINKAVLRNFPLMVPPLDVQLDIATALEQRVALAEQTRSAIRRQLDTIAKLPSAILREAFNGSL